MVSRNADAIDLGYGLTPASGNGQGVIEIEVASKFRNRCNIAVEHDGIIAAQRVVAHASNRLHSDNEASVGEKACIKCGSHIAGHASDTQRQHILTVTGWGSGGPTMRASGIQ